MNKVVDNEYDCGCQTGRDIDTGAAFVRHCTEHHDEVREKVEDLIYQHMLDIHDPGGSYSLSAQAAARDVLLTLE